MKWSVVSVENYRYGRSPASDASWEALQQGDWWHLQGISENGVMSPPLLARVDLVDGRPTLTGLAIGFPGTGGISQTDLHSISVHQLVSTLAPTEHSYPLDLWDPPEVPDNAEGFTDEFFQAVANEYRRALVLNPRSPMHILEERFPQRSSATIRRWIQRARDRGLLGDRPRGMAGEIQRDITDGENDEIRLREVDITELRDPNSLAGSDRRFTREDEAGPTP